MKDCQFGVSPVNYSDSDLRLKVPVNNFDGATTSWVLPVHKILGLNVYFAQGHNPAEVGIEP